ncbi:MAG: hypothetical protein KDD40_00865 [Bdellovibrionales bacterium]|mgnify:CR=1 FL=1|nr:hypothetical protein [Bdellovibrionales bacterium]
MTDVTHQVRLEARKNYLVKKADVEETEIGGRPAILVTASCYYANDCAFDVDKLVTALRKKVPRGYTLKVRLEFQL